MTFLGTSQSIKDNKHYCYVGWGPERGAPQIPRMLKRGFFTKAAAQRYGRRLVTKVNNK